MSKQFFHFTLGPVQGFVGQARRTRDLWAGSFLLSYLSAVALKETQAQQGVILFPAPDKKFLQALEGNTTTLPKQGSIPNRFKAEVPINLDPTKVLSAVDLAWQAIAQSVVAKDLQPHSIWGAKQQENWDQQIQNFWEISWAISNDQADSAILDKRKNWRSHFQPTQFGDKCMMMEGYQELSAEPRPNSAKQKEFWKIIQTQKGMSLDLRDKEKLCAMAFLKRRFTKVFQELSVDMPSGWTLKGWKLPESVPSVQYLAAAHWIESLVKQFNDPKVLEAADTFYQIAQKHANRSEFNSNINCIKNAQEQTNKHLLTTLDGAVFYESLLESASVFEPDESKEILRSLKQLKRSANNLDVLPPFYTILLMDGDSLGIQMSDEKKQPIISKALDQFTSLVPQIIQDNNGFLIYAGGDDVLAILPLQDAIPAAIACRKAYEGCFKGTIVHSTLSGAIEYVHIKSPLMKAIHQSHSLLDDVAKNQTGRDAIAIRINKPGNENALWSMPWEYAMDDNDEHLKLEKLAQLFTLNEQVSEGLSSKFIYSLRDKYAQFNFEDFTPTQTVNLILSEYLSSGHAISDPQKSRILITELLGQMYQYSRETINEDFTLNCHKIDINAGLIARFLAQKGME